jgi:superfamily II DNA/RNA helicase
MVMEGRSVIAQAHPKAGKTTSLAISILQSINTNSNDTQALALCPTDWSATNIQSTIHALGGNIGVRCFAYTSNASIGKTLLRLATDRSPHVVIGAPDGVLNLIRKGILRTDNVKMLVLEDMDQLINMGFKDQILDIHRLLPSRIQSIAMSTTLPQSFLETSTKVAVNPIRVTVERDVYMPIPEGIKQFHIDVHRDDRSKFKLIYHLFSILNVWPAVVFCNHTPQAGLILLYNSHEMNLISSFRLANSKTSWSMVPIM